MATIITEVWVFNGARGQFPSGVFRQRATAEEWISKHKLTGTLTFYPLDVGVYEWAIERGFFQPRREDQHAPDFIQRFSSASQEHYHYENGQSS